MDSQPIFVVVMVIGILGILFIGLPWLIFHYVTRWKSQATLTNEDEKLLDELHDLARRLDDRMCSIERIMSAENPNWRSVACDPAATGLEALNVPSQPRRIGQ
ncbi:MAG: phage shock protein [Sphingomonadales bacterium]|jgi:phage shock protein B|nr:phage shock protein [Sphingomonadales bacterium]MEA3034666.1 phage shock protein [Sphingomonadales bacterium]